VQGYKNHDKTVINQQITKSERTEIIPKNPDFRTNIALIAGI
jgi:hypothetical protein